MLTVKQQAFVRAYLSRDSRYHGNATASYKKAYGDSGNERVAQASGSRLLRLPAIKRKIDTYLAKAAQANQVDANFVLEQSIRIYDRAMGDEAVEIDVIAKDGTVRAVEERSHNPAIAVKALELIGKHTSIQAFQDNVEHTHTHRLEQALAARQKQVESKAAAQPDVIEGRAQRIDHDTGAHAVEEEAEKGGSSPEVRPNAEIAQAKRA